MFKVPVKATTQYYKWEYIDTYTPVFSNEFEAAVTGKDDVKLLTTTSYYTLTQSITRTFGRGNIITFDMGPNAVSLNSFGYIGVVSVGHWPGMRATNIECSIDGQNWTLIQSAFGGRGDYLSNPLKLENNNYRYLRFTTWIDDGRYSIGGAHDLRIGYTKKRAIKATKDDYDFVIQGVPQYAAQIGKLIPMDYIKDNVLINGAAVLENHIMRDFTKYGGYFSIPIPINVMENDWEFYTEFKTGNSLGTQYFIGCLDNNYSILFCIESSVFRLYLSSGSNWNIASGSTWELSAATNTYYKIKFGYKEKRYFLDIAVGEGQELSRSWTSGETTAYCAKVNEWRFNRAWSANNDFYGEIYLDKSYFNIAGKRIWQGTQQDKRLYQIYKGVKYGN